MCRRRGTHHKHAHRAMGKPPLSSRLAASRADGSALSRRSAVLLGLVAAGSFELPASANPYAASGGAVLSTPPLSQLPIESWLKLAPKKVEQRAAVVAPERLKSLSRQLDEFLSDVPDAPPKGLDALTDEVKRRELDTDQARELQKALEKRGQLLAKLDAQPAWIVYGAACLGAFGSTVIMHPVDTVKTIQISQAEKGDPFELPPLSQLYTGLSANLLKEVPPSAVYLGVYELIKLTLSSSPTFLADSPLLVYLIAGAAGEGIGSIIRAPSEAAKSRVQSGLARNVPEAFNQIVMDEAMRRSTFNSWATSVLRDVPFGALQIAVFESLKTAIVQSPTMNLDIDSIYSEAILGAIGGFVGSVASTPADVLVTRIITQTPSEDGTRLGTLGMFKKILQEEGPRGFLTGVGARALYWTPAIGIFLALYCSFRKLCLDIGLGM